MLRYMNRTDLALKPPLTHILVALESLRCIGVDDKVGVEEIIP